jgi:hypothetical protein
MLESPASAWIASAPGRVSSSRTRLADRTASAGNDAMRLASRATKASSSASGSARLIQPYRSATSALTSAAPKPVSGCPGWHSPGRRTACRRLPVRMYRLVNVCQNQAGRCGAPVTEPSPSRVTARAASADGVSRAHIRRFVPYLGGHGDSFHKRYCLTIARPAGTSRP